MKKVKINLIKGRGTLSTLFHIKFAPTKDTGVAFLAGIAMILASFALYLFYGESIKDEIVFFVIKDIVMMVGIGFIFPLYYVLVIKRESIKTFGITKDKLSLSLVLNIILAVLLLLQFMNESAAVGKKILLSSDAIIPLVYIFTAGIFEMVFFYGFLLHQFEQSFGILPGIVLTAIFYSFHHAGFQPEFLKLLFVGVMYASVFRITKNVFIIFPFFWGLGATWDVLVNFGAKEQLQGFWTLTKTILVLVLMFGFLMYLKNEGATKQEQKRLSHYNCS